MSAFHQQEYALIDFHPGNVMVADPTNIQHSAIKLVDHDEIMADADFVEDMRAATNIISPG